MIARPPSEPPAEMVPPVTDAGASPQPGRSTRPQDILADELRVLGAEFDLQPGRPRRVAESCRRMRQALGDGGPIPPHAVAPLVGLLRRRVGPLAAELFSFLEEAAAGTDDAWPLLEGMLAAADRALALRALSLCVRLAGSEALPVDGRAVGAMAARFAVEGSPLADAGPLAQVAALLRHLPGEAGADPVLGLYLGEEPWAVRRLAARILDLDRKPVPAPRARRLLGTGVHELLRPYLEYSRAGHGDVLEVASGPGRMPFPLDDLRRAEAACGRPLLQRALAALGWPRLRLGLEARPVVALRMDGSFPLLLSPAEADLFDGCPGALRSEPMTLFVAHGGAPEAGPAAGEAEQIARFRRLNLVHAEILEDLLDVAPLDPGRVARILAGMDRVVDDFVSVFREHAEECRILPSVYQGLRDRILRALEGERGRDVLSPELTRLVQAFEDPPTLGAVSTVHGLKRHLHQRGLQLGFRLLRGGQATNRTVDLLVASRSAPLEAIRKIGYVDFEPEPRGSSALPSLPYPVRIAVDAFAHQICHGQTRFPDVRIFCYGGEVHYYIEFRNHPVFLRVSFAPPVQGGMVDLEYFGVSQYDLAHHPNPRLDAIAAFLHAMDFEVRIDAAHVHARYDKEQAADLGDVRARAERILALVPYLMDLDWVIGGLDLTDEARARVAAAWSGFLARWRVLPLDRLLTPDRRGIAAPPDGVPPGTVEGRWSGLGPYADRLSTPAPRKALEPFLRRVRGLGLEEIILPADGGEIDFSQTEIERRFLAPLRAARDRGEMVVTAAGIRRHEPDLYRREGAAATFARMISGVEAALPAAAVAALAAPLDRFLCFETVGSVNGHEVQVAPLALRGGSVFLHVLRDRDGIVRLAFFAEDPVLHSRRRSPADAWIFSGSTDGPRLAAILRRDGYLAAAGDPAARVGAEETASLLAGFRHPRPSPSGAPLPEDGAVEGLRAAPGRAVGAAALGTAAREPEELEGCILVAASVGPGDSAHIYRSRAVVSTGGGILSHAGLLAAQFGRPALMVAGEWSSGPGGRPLLLLRSRAYREETSDLEGFRVTERRNLREVLRPLREGDLVVVDAREGYLQVLGQDRATRTLHDEMAAVVEASRKVAGSAEPRRLLALRGRQLRALHQLRKLLARIDDPLLARHALRELLLGGGAPADACQVEKAELLSILLGNPRVAAAARGFLGRMAEDLGERFASLRRRALERIPASESLYEILDLRRGVLHLGVTLEELATVLRACDLALAPPEGGEIRDVDRASRDRLLALRAHLHRRVRGAPEEDREIRRPLRRLRRLDEALGLPGHAGDPAGDIHRRLRRRDDATRRTLRHRRILQPEDGGLELHPLSGWKAANLAEMERILGDGSIPRWFVVTQRAFEEMLGMPVPAAEGAEASLGEAIRDVLARPGLSGEQRSRRIADLWERAPLVSGLADEVAEAHRRLVESGPAEGEGDGFVSVRSSSREEDTEAAARAGEFETFLFVRGREEVLRHLRRAWAGLWTERAIHNRAVLGLAPEGRGGGMIVQRMVRARVAGVMTTVNVADGVPTEMVINAGLGLGEGIVSGVAAADHIVVPREGLHRDPVRFRYRIADKREQVVFDRKTGRGTVRTETLYHQRLRPALDYRELCELARAAARLEESYGHPLDIEFAIEGSRLYLLQARPLASFLALLRETAERFPLARPPAGIASAPGGPS